MIAPGTSDCQRYAGAAPPEAAFDGLCAAGRVARGAGWDAGDAGSPRSTSARANPVSAALAPVHREAGDGPRSAAIGAARDAAGVASVPSSWSAADSPLVAAGADIDNSPACAVSAANAAVTTNSGNHRAFIASPHADGRKGPGIFPRQREDGQQRRPDVPDRGLPGDRRFDALDACGLAMTSLGPLADLVVVDGNLCLKRRRCHRTLRSPTRPVLFL